MTDQETTRAIIRESVEASIEAKRRFFAMHEAEVERVARLLVERLRAGGKILIFGNGGSAADAQHIAAELVNRFAARRQALPALALTTDSSVLTSIANDADFEAVFSRQLEAFGCPGDVAFAISTSGNSPNILAGLRVARAQGMDTVALLGNDGGRARGMADHALVVDSATTARIQEVHITLAHILCDLIEREFSAGAAP